MFNMRGGFGGGRGRGGRADRKAGRQASQAAAVARKAADETNYFWDAKARAMVRCLAGPYPRRRSRRALKLRA